MMELLQLDGATTFVRLWIERAQALADQRLHAETRIAHALRVLLEVEDVIAIFDRAGVAHEPARRACDAALAEAGASRGLKARVSPSLLAALRATNDVVRPRDFATTFDALARFAEPPVAPAIEATRRVQAEVTALVDGPAVLRAQAISLESFDGVARTVFARALDRAKAAGQATLTSLHLWVTLLDLTERSGRGAADQVARRRARLAEGERLLAALPKGSPTTIDLEVMMAFARAERAGALTFDGFVAASKDEPLVARMRAAAP